MLTKGYNNTYTYSHRLLRITPITELRTRDRKALENAAMVSTSSSFDLRRRMGACLVQGGLCLKGRKPI